MKRAVIMGLGLVALLASIVMPTLAQATSSPRDTLATSAERVGEAGADPAAGGIVAGLQAGEPEAMAMGVAAIAALGVGLSAVVIAGRRRRVSA